MLPVEWNVEKSKDVTQQYHHWLELISKYEALNGEKVSDTIKITLALQNVRGNLAQSLNVSVSETTTWSHVHMLFSSTNYSSNAAPVETKGMYQLNNFDKKEEVDFVKKGNGKGHKQKDLKKKGSKGSSSNFQMAKGKVYCQVLWKVRSSSSAMLVEYSAARSSESATSSEVKASLQYLRVSSGSTNSDSSTRPTSRISRSTTSCSTSTKRTKSSQVSSHYGSVSSVLPHPGQVGGFSGHRLNINHVTHPFSSEVEVKEVRSSFTYPIGPSLPQYLQEPWAALNESLTQEQSLQLHPRHLHRTFLSLSTQVNLSM